MTSKNIITSVLAVVSMITIVSCSTPETLTLSNIRPLPQDADRIIHAQNDFAFKIFDLVNQQDQSNKNKLISPLSIYMDLSMVYNGAAEQTKKDMQKALQLSDSSMLILNKTNAVLLNNLPNIDPSVNIDIANAIWYRETLNPLHSFIKTNKKYYNATIEGASFDPSTVKDINDWVKEKTHHKINSIIKTIQPSDIMFLLNAVYFKGSWKNEFDPKLTQNRKFYGVDNEFQVPFMHQKASYNYAENDALQIVEMPYGDESFSMYVLLPKNSKNINALISSLNTDTFHSLIEKMHHQKIKLNLPRWESSYKIDNLKSILTEMGMGSAFSHQANFSNMYKKQAAKISQVKHKTYIKVDEEGTEAAAVTSTGIRTTSIQINIPIMDVNHPFVYLIRENNSENILFIGEVNNPKE